MDKLKPHYPLADIKAFIRDGRFHITAAALKSSFNDFGMTAEDIAEEVLSIEYADFYKSMTSRLDPSLWQDVYHRAMPSGTAYIKLQIVDDETVVISFKEK